ncbi:hypothetical protein DO021_11845 [Desulfobacter hydrogenophilus]|uniref:Uncharacterized protein n=1 Tax=Desulfobacter hydrogenophilus TaxID=2291 RepID=A0A328FEE4_9BACT|nr:hypothetical protein [Desulfobacter hydrogenophilus]NDY72359.1 hypothetical protein [Desulfobacter hydrogenophilus]QBH13086.1 hypothetical protein EYB58_09245 [Desulfobacter hydrogenophilus]RAM01792.1 hypothetical protein DO021_11845 [Desulfobacter hydrogenophilus]
MITAPSLHTWFKGAIAGFFLMTARYGLVLAGLVYQTQVRGVSADNGPDRIDPGIQDMIKEIGPVFKYTRFRLLSDRTMLLTQGQKKVMPLPGGQAPVHHPQGHAEHAYSISPAGGYRRIADI